MNVVLIVSDTFRRDHLGCYGNKSIHTPNLDRLAEESVVFDRAFCGSFPTLPCRAELFTGRFVFPYLNWGPLPAGEVLLSETFARGGYTCTMVTDNLPLTRSGYGYDRGFHTRLHVRGQWYDNYRGADAPFVWPCPAEKLQDGPDGRIQQYLRNAAAREVEEDWFAPQVVDESIRWLERHHNGGPFFLYVDLFDPHEPWDPPREYVDLYDPDGTGDDVVYPSSGSAAVYPPEDLRRIRALYSGEVTMVDRWTGKLLDALRSLGREGDTTVAFLSDHGILLGERGLIGKMGKSKAVIGWPTYPEVSRVPLMIRVPGAAPGRSGAFVHPGDLAPTLLDIAGLKIPTTMGASSLVPLLRGEIPAVRDVAVSSWSLRGWSAHRPSVVRSDEWALYYWRAGIRPQLFHLPSDPNEETDVYGANRREAAELHSRYVGFLRRHNAPMGNLLPRAYLGAAGKRDSRLSLNLR